MQRIVNVKYGNGPDVFDVTHIVRMLFKHKIYKVHINNDVFAEDPAPKKQKELTIKFANGKYKRFPEGSIFTVDPELMSFGMKLDEAKINKIMSRFTDIYYGCSGNYMTVTDIIRNHLECGNTEIKISTINMHHDHCFGKVKHLMAMYTDGRIVRIAYNNTFHVDGHRSIGRNGIKSALLVFDRDTADVTDHVKKLSNISVSELNTEFNADADLKIIAANGDSYIFPPNDKVAIN